MIPLVVDLDGTLVKTDFLQETANAYIAKHPLQCLSLLAWFIRGGKLEINTRLANDASLDVATLPYNKQLMTWLQEQENQGRRVVLMTGSPSVMARSVSLELGFSPDILDTRSEINPHFLCKHDLLIQRYGEKGFDYVGLESSDIRVTQAAHCTFLVDDSTCRMIKKGALIDSEIVIEFDNKPIIISWIKALRFHQWVKNVLIFAPLLAAHQIHRISSLWSGFMAFLVFGLTASSVYLLNDLLDVSDDRHHPRKRERPFAAGNLGLAAGWATWPILLTISFGLAYALLPMGFMLLLGIYFILTVIYSFKIKQIALLDVIILASLYTIRIIAGSVATHTPLSFWILIFSLFLFLSLAFIKRFSELKASTSHRQESQLRGRGYVTKDLGIVSSMGISAGYLAVLVLALYIQDPHTAQLYRSPKLIWFACPLLLFWISRAWLISLRGQMHDDPIVFALKDVMSWIIAFCLMADLLLAQVTR